jgi:predicted AAA+ superfamily ATPase
VARIFKFSHLNEEIRARDLKLPLDSLCHAGIFQRIYATTASGLPLHAYVKDNRFKLLYLDVGLLQTATKVDAQLFFSENLHQINAGMIAEQFVGQELLAYSLPFQNAPLLFWEREGSDAEVDFLITIGSSIVPIEVKAGATGSLRSLHLFLKEKHVPFGIRISEQPLSLRDNILSVPFYLINRLDTLVKQI